MQNLQDLVELRVKGKKKRPRFNIIACKKVQIYLLCVQKLSQDLIVLRVKRSKFTFFTHKNLQDLIELNIKAPNLPSLRAKESKI